MEIEIKRLVPGLVEDYLRFFDQTPHDDGLDEHRCYCIVNAVQKRCNTSFEPGGFAAQLKNRCIPIFKCVYYSVGAAPTTGKCWRS